MQNIWDSNKENSKINLKDYGVYFSILALISRGMTSQSEIDSVIQKNTGAYLANLDKVYDVIKPIRPLFSKTESRNARWQITDSYLRFYFRFIYANQNLIELGQYELLKSVILRDYETFTGKTLELYFINKINEEKQVSKIGGWWDRKGQNEVDLIAVNDFEKTCDIYEVKGQANRINLSKLAEKVDILKTALKSELSGYSVKTAGLSMEDM